MTNPLIVFSTQGWTDLWVSKHWIAKEFSKDRLVLFVEPPSWLKPVDIRTRKFIDGEVREIDDNLYVLGRVTFPYPYRVPAIVRPLWRRLLQLQLENALNLLAIEEFDVLNFDPHSLPLIKALGGRVKSNVYYAVDPPLGSEDAIWPERRCVRESDSVFAVTPILRDLLEKESGREDIAVLPHGVDFKNGANTESAPSAGVKEALEKIHPGKTVIGYTGAIHDVCIDRQVVLNAIKKRPNWQFVFVGPYDGSALSKKGFDIVELDSHDNVLFLGAFPYVELKYLISKFDVCIVPYNENKNVGWERRSPFKVLGYLAQGKPVVISSVPAAKNYENNVFQYSGKDDFIFKCEEALLDANSDARVRFAARHDFSELKAKLLRSLELSKR